MKNFEIKKIIINKSQSNNRLDQALTKLINEYSRTQIKILLENKNIKKENEIITEASYKVKEGEEYFISIPKINNSKLIPQDISLNIIYEDNDLIVINKPAGMVTHPAPGNQEKTLVNGLLYHTKNNLSFINENNRPGIIHRLDKDTSGLIVVAKNNKTHLDLTKQFKEHSVSRKYLSIVWGIPDNKIIKGYIKRHKVNRKKMALNYNSDGKYSETSIRLLESYEICSLIECTLKTGRTHQVRVHMNSINHPIIGDKLYGKTKTNQYGKNKKNFNKFLLLKNFNRQALHAFTIGFIHPTTKKNIDFESELANDMLELLEYL